MISRREQLHAREQDLLGYILSRQELPEAVAELKPEWFTAAEHQQAFAAVQALAKQSKPHDLFAVRDWLDHEFPLNPDEAADRGTYLIEMAQNSGAMSLTHTVRALVDQGRRRELRSALLAAAAEMDGHESYAEAMGAALSKLDTVVMADTAKGLMTATEIAQIGIDWIDERFSQPDSLPGLTTPFADLDDVTYGLKRGELITVAGATAMGKTTFGTNIAEHVAKTKRVLVVTREMGESQIAIRHFASLGGIPMSVMQTGNLRDEDWNKLAAATSRMADSLMEYDLDSSTVNQISLRSRQLQRKYGDLGLIVIDHIGLLESDRRRDARHLEVADITRGLKQLARELDIPVVQLVQVARAVTTRADKRPTLADLSESSSIEKDSDIVIGMYRDDYYNPDSPMKGMAEAIVLKNRMGACKTIPLVFEGMFNRFKPADFGAYYEARNQQPAKGQSASSRL